MTGVVWFSRRISWNAQVTFQALRICDVKWINTHNSYKINEKMIQ